MPRTDFDTYMYSVQSHRYNTKSNPAAIHFYEGASLVGHIYFNYDETLANRDPKIVSNRIYLYYHMSMLDTIIDMLRNEDSVYIFHNVSTKLGYLNTGKEEVGEEES